MQNQGREEGRRILIVDDEPDITSSFKQALRDNGFEQVETVNDPILSFEQLRGRFGRSANYRYCNARNGWIQPIRRS